MQTLGMLGVEKRMEKTFFYPSSFIDFALQDSQLRLSLKIGFSAKALFGM